MLKRKLLEKSTGLFLATMMGMSMMTGQVEAKSNILNDIIGALAKPSITASNRNRSSNNTDPMPQKVNLPLDGTYSRVYFPKGLFRHESIVAEHYFELDRPAEVDLHFIGHANRLHHSYIYDSDSNKLGSAASVSDGTADKNIVLSPGRYVIKTKIQSNTPNREVNFEVKGIKHDIYPTVTAVGNRRYDANVLYYNVEAIDYFPYATHNEIESKYYKFVLQSPMEIKFIFEKLSKNCDISIYLLDEDESELDSWSGIYNDHMEKIKYLNAGTYYLKLKRYDNNGSVYSIRIK